MRNSLVVLVLAVSLSLTAVLGTDCNATEPAVREQAADKFRMDSSKVNVHGNSNLSRPVSDDIMQQPGLKDEVSIFSAISPESGSPLPKEPGDVYVPAESAGKVIMNSIGMELRLIPAGSFIVGSPENEKGRRSNEGPQHKVTISRPFYLGVYEVTQEQYEKVMGSNPSKFKGSRRPVENVKWQDALTFCKKLSNKEKTMQYRLPTEAEWEYAARAGTGTAFFWGDEMDGEYCWYLRNSGSETKEVGTRKPNPWGLYDMCGNVWEWCEDWYGNKIYSSSERLDPKGPSSGVNRVIRGGGWYADSHYCRSAYRDQATSGLRGDVAGFRVLAVPVDR